MAFAGDGRKLTGSDGTVYRGVLGATVVGDGATDMPVGYHVAVTVTTTTPGFPTQADSANSDPIRPGDVIAVRTGQSIQPTANESYKTITLTELCDISSFTMPFSADEIETTTFCDIIKTYEPGKVDVAGTLTGITTIGTTTDEDGFLRQFIDIIKQDGTTSYDVYTQSASILFGYFVANKTQAKGDEIAVFAPINIFGASIGGDQASAQSFDSSFRFASHDEVNPALYRFSYT